MSSVRRASSGSVASACSRRFFSRITVCDLCGLLQRLGSEACFSISANCGRSLAASKILPEFVDFVLEEGVFLFEFFEHISINPYGAFVSDTRRCKQRLYWGRKLQNL